MHFTSIYFTGFIDREKKLRNIKRYSAYPVMFYRTDVWFHSQRVLWIVEELIPYALKSLPSFNPEIARTLALIHDDAEIITTDVNLVYKVQMTKKQLHDLDEQEEKAINELSHQWPKRINGFNYKELLMRMLKKDTVESQFVSLSDKLDAYGESSHELFAGNTSFTWPDKISPIEIYTLKLQEFSKQYPFLKNLFLLDHPFLQVPYMYNIHKIAQMGKPHTVQSIKKNTGITHYDFWKKRTIARMGEKGIKILTTQKEFDL